jgi:hypothetical protein
VYTIDKMLPCFHSVGHDFFTKSAHLYLHYMMALEQRMDPTEFKIFIEQNFTIRRSDKFWPGLWSDLIADVVYEKLQWIGTLHGISSSELAQWTVKMGFIINILVYARTCTRRSSN